MNNSLTSASACAILYMYLIEREKNKGEIKMMEEKIMKISGAEMEIEKELENELKHEQKKLKKDHGN